MVQALGKLGHGDRLPINSLSVVDGDQVAQQGTLSLPGNLAPERQVFQDIAATGIVSLGQRLELPESRVATALTNAMTQLQHHDWISHAATNLGLAESYLWQTMCMVWVRNCLAQGAAQALVDGIRAKLP
jgi:hypothetical protein